MKVQISNYFSTMWNDLLKNIQSQNVLSLARAISLVENEVDGYETFLESLPKKNVPIIGITGPPGAGKSTLTDGLIGSIVEKGKRVGVLCIDPSSPFNLGALLGDRIRMSNWYMHPDVYIRSLATRGSLGGLHPAIIEITEVMKAAFFDYIIIETVGVGQSEIEIAGLADVTLVVIVPEAGDEIQTMKAGLMEIANIFVVNKADREGADTFVKNLRMMLAPAFIHNSYEVPILKTVATTKEGLDELLNSIEKTLASFTNERKAWLLSERAYRIIQRYRMRDVSKEELKNEFLKSDETNLHRVVKKYKS